MKKLHINIMFTSLNHMTHVGMRLAVALHAIQLGASPAVVGALTATFALLPSLCSVYLGRLIDRKGAQPFILACTVLLAASAIAAALLPQLATLVVAALLTGGAYMLLHMINQQIVGRLSQPEDRPRNFALSATWVAATAALSPAVTGFAIDHAGFRWTYVMLAAAPLSSMLFILLGKLPRLEGRAPLEKSAPTGGVAQLLRNPALRHVYLINVMFATSWDVFMVMTPLYGASLKLSASQIGLIVASFSVATFSVRMLAGPLSRHYTPWQLLLMSLALNGASSLAFGLVGIVPLLMLFACMMGLGHGLANPMMNTLLYETAPPARIGEVMGLRTTVSMSMQVTLPMLAGALSAWIGIAPLYWLVASLQFGGTYASRLNWHAKRRVDPIAPAPDPDTRRP